MVYHTKGGGCSSKVDSLGIVMETFLFVYLIYVLQKTELSNFCLRYHEAGAKVKARVLELLRELSAELQFKINALVFASMLLVIAKALFAHVRWGTQK